MWGDCRLGVGHSVVCFRVAVLGSFPVHRYFRNAEPHIQCSLVTAEHQRPEKRLAALGGQQPRKNGRRRRQALICTAWCVEELRVQVGVALPRWTRCSFVFRRAGRGAPRESWSRAGLLGRIARDRVRGLPHGGRPLAGGGTLLDWRWKRPVSFWRWWRELGSR